MAATPVVRFPGSVTTMAISVNNLPSLSVAGGSICSGGSFTLNPSGALSYTYSSGGAVVTPSGTSSYSVFGTNAAGCVNTRRPWQPLLLILFRYYCKQLGTICAGQPFVINPSDSSYSYSGGSNFGNARHCIYSVTGTSSAGCVSSAPATLTVTVNPLPTITVTTALSVPEQITR